MQLLSDRTHIFPSTRYQGSKLKLVKWIEESLKNLNFHSVLDGFSGTGSVSCMFKSMGKQVTSNDILKFNFHTGFALIENDSVKISDNEMNFLLKRQSHIKYPSFISDTFKDIYFTDEENEWIDTVRENINHLDDKYKKSLALFALFQSCIIKRPFNLFHRKNLYMRLSDVKRNFGNKTTWDTPFEVHFKKFIEEGNRAVFSNGQNNRALNMDIFDIDEIFDLVYIDTPYISGKGVGVDYRDFYHFLEGLVNYSSWHDLIDYKSKHRKLIGNGNIWSNKNEIYKAFDRLFDKFKESILVISYRSDGIPSIQELKNLLKKYKPDVEELRYKNYKYVLSHSKSEEILLLGI
ncbi:MAG: DNA adenine methylase [Candidatus Eremiobacterota bacterium]